jgi:hypothetical protein
MTRRTPIPAALPLCLVAAAALAAPPLSIPIPRPTPEQEALIVAEEEETRIREELEEARQRAEAAEPSVSAAEPSVSADEPSAPAVAPPAPALAQPAPAVAPPAPAVVPPAPAFAQPAPAVAQPAPAVAPPVRKTGSAPEASASRSGSDVFRRDPFWPVAVARERKAEHDARVAARIETEKREAAIRKAREDAIARGVDVSELDDDEISRLSGPTALPAPGPKSGGSFDGATEEQWDAALAKLPPRSGYLGGKRPALMLKGDKAPHYVGDRLCVTNRGVAYTWRIASVDFRSYTHELKRVSAKPVP